MKKTYGTEIGIEKKIIILTTKTVEFLLSVNPDALTLYLFYIKNAKIQKTNNIFNVESFGMKGLHWGRDRYRNAKSILVKEGFIENVVRRNDKGQILGHFLKIKYLFSKDKVDNSLSRIIHPVEQPNGGKKETNALSNKTINALSNKKEKEKDEPFSYKEEMKKLKNSTWKPDKIFALYLTKKGLSFDNEKKLKLEKGVNLRALKKLEAYNSIEINKAMDYCLDKYYEIPWNCHTVVKVIGQITNKR